MGIEFVWVGMSIIQRFHWFEISFKMFILVLAVSYKHTWCFVFISILAHSLVQWDKSSNSIEFSSSWLFESKFVMGWIILQNWDELHLGFDLWIYCLKSRLARNGSGLMSIFSRKGSKKLKQHRDQRKAEAPLKSRYLCVICNLLIHVSPGFGSQVNFAHGPLGFLVTYTLPWNTAN